MKDKTLRRYLLWTFALAWALQAVAIVLAHRGELQGFRLVLALSMYAPFAAVLLAGIGLRGMGWKPRLKGKLRWVLAAWFGPILLTVLGAALYFVIFPTHFDAGGSLIAAQLGEEGLAQLESAGMTLRTYALVQSAAALTWAPWLNMLAALGEEVGWRGALYPRLKARFGVGKGRLLGGLIWGVWHWPIMILAGYNYGTQYWGAPVLGPLVFCLAPSPSACSLTGCTRRRIASGSPPWPTAPTTPRPGCPLLFSQLPAPIIPPSAPPRSV